MASTKVAAAGEIPNGGAIRVTLPNGFPVAVFHLDGEYYAVGDTCSHELASLSDGDVDTDEPLVECPKHGAAFDLRTGNALTLPATRPVPSFAVSIRDGDLYVEHD